ncbi:MAG: pyruvate kinase [Cyclobacteriaceae bacterium]|nr:pyruvate kinase [Cyclobacteriaceae bacterium]
MRKKTKIVATISDKNCDPDFLRALRRAGMNVVRLNTAHQTHEDTLKVIKSVRQVSERIALLLDTKGPEIRTTSAEESIPVTFGDKIYMKGDPAGITSRECIYVNYAGFVEDVHISSRVLIDDGDIEMIVVAKEGDRLLCEVKNNGFINGRKSVNIPSVSVKLPALTQKDIDFIHFAVDNDVDFIAHSFVRNKEDIIKVQEILCERGSQMKVIAKIENQEGVDNIDEILDHVYGIMVARGDLAVEIPQERIPIVQKMIVDKCIMRRKPVIIATQMLHSMINNPRPTRAEISDVANAIYDGADAVMLSGETAYGKYPERTVETMSQIAIEVEAAIPLMRDTPRAIVNNEVSAFLAYSAVRASVELGAKAIIADTENGRTIRALAAYRGAKLIFAECYCKRTMRELALSYGVYVNYCELGNQRMGFLKPAIDSLINKSKLKSSDKVVVIGGNFGHHHGPTFLEVATIEMMEELLERVYK